MRILRAGDHKRMPWKNGGGETTEIAVFPEDAGLSDFDWRVSMARVDGDGPFSSFPGIDRTLAILDGAGIVLDVAGQAPKRLTHESQPHAFSADSPTSAQLVSGTVLDFNVMSRRSKIEHRVERLHGPRSATARFIRLVLCARGSIEISTSGTSETLGLHDAVILRENEALEMAPAQGSEFYLVEFRPT